MDIELIANYIATVCLPLSVLFGIGLIILMIKLRSKNKLIKKMEYDNVLQGYVRLLEQYKTFTDKINGKNIDENN